MAVLDYYKRDAVWARDREFSASADQRANGGFDLRSPTGNPGTWLTAGKPGFTDNTVFPACPAGSPGLFSGTTTCLFNFQPFIFLLPPTERKGAFARGVVEITQNLTAFAEFSYNKNETENSAAPTPGSFDLPIGHNSNPYPFAVRIRYRFTDVGPRVSTITSETKRAIVGLKGLGFGWDWEVGYNSSRNEAANRQRQYVSQTAVNSLVSNNIYNFVNQAANTPELVNSLKANPFRIANSELDAIDAKASRELMQLANGPLALALGVERRKEVAKDRLDPLSAANLIVGSGGTTANGERTLTSAYAEFSIPALKNVEVQAAIRTDNYSGGVGRATKPKLAVSWKVQPNLLVRGSYAGGFRAPSLSEAFLGQTTSFPAFVDTPRCNAYRAAFGTPDPRSVAVCGSNQVRTLSGGNPNLKPEESKSWLFGAVWEPTNDLNFSLDHYRIDHKEKIRRPSTAFQLNNPQGYPNTIFRDPQSATDILVGAPGVLQGLGSDTRYGLFQSYFNSARQLTEGLDLEGRYRLGLGEMGRLSFVSSTSYVISFQVQTAQGQLLAEQAGTNGFPRTTSTNSVFWNKGNWDTGITTRTRSKFLQQNAVTKRNVASYTTADLQVAWTGIKNLRVAAGSTNFLDTKPPFDDNTNDGYQNSTDSPLGRYYYARLTYSWK